MTNEQIPKRAAYYARVSTSFQEEKGTIESQKNELLQQIKKDGNILVKEYVDNGWSGGTLDRPAIDELRSDLKTDLFDVVYFHDSDRIARDVTSQNIIIAEFLKYRKGIIIKGVNYIDNPENKFTLTVLGAVNELEKAKITERLSRGRKDKARRGAIVNNANPFGYTHIHRVENKPGEYVVNEDQAEIVRLIFDQYAYSDTSLHKLVRLLEDRGVKTPQGRLSWRRTTIKNILNNTTYYGEHHYNRTQHIESLPERRRKQGRYTNTKTGVRLREEAEWIKIKVPAIIDKEVFDIVQEKLKKNRKLLRSSVTTHILSGLITCGVCDHAYSAVSNTTPRKRLYRCNYREKGYGHSVIAMPNKCNNRSIKAETIETLVLNALEEKIFQPSVVMTYVDIFKDGNQTIKKRAEENLQSIQKQIDDIEVKRQRILDLYADSLLDKAGYYSKLDEFSTKHAKLLKGKAEIEQKLTLLERRKNAKKAVSHYVQLVKKNYARATYEQKVQIARTVIKTVVLSRNEGKNEIIIKGVLPTEAPLVVNLNKSDEVYYCISYFNSVALYHSTTPEFKNSPF